LNENRNTLASKGTRITL